MKRVFLVGFMGAGKTTLGAEAARRLSIPFFDLDERIVEDAGLSVSEIFEKEGERGFRERETKALRAIVEESPGIVATGGGAFTVEENRKIMSEKGVSVWLDVPTDVLLSRVRGHDRPLWASVDEICDLAERRKKDYRLATIALELADDSTEENVSKLECLLVSHL